MNDLRRQAERFGTEIRFGYVSAIDFSSHPHRVVIDEIKHITADTVIIATGAMAKWLGLPSEQQYNGFGVSMCALCDGYFFKAQDIAIVGAGDTAAEEADACKSHGNYQFKRSIILLNIKLYHSNLQQKRLNP